MIGPPGAGKSGALILLLLEALKQRKQLPDREHAFAAPVPVLLSIGDWDPYREELIPWAAKRLAQDYGTVRTPSGRPLYRPLLDDGHIALFLDGFDEMPPELWSKAREKIEATVDLRVVRHKPARDRPQRSQAPELLQPGHEVSRVAYATRVHLNPVAVGPACEYLEKATAEGPHPELWRQLTARMRVNQQQELVAALTPLMLSLAVSTYDRDESLRSRRSGRSYEVQGRSVAERRTAQEHHSDRVRSNGNNHRRHRQTPEEQRVDPEAAIRYLTAMARRMGTTRDLRWWRIREWMPWLQPLILGAVFMLIMGAVSWRVGQPSRRASAGWAWSRGGRTRRWRDRLDRHAARSRRGAWRAGADVGASWRVDVGRSAVRGLPRTCASLGRGGHSRGPHARVARCGARRRRWGNAWCLLAARRPLGCPRNASAEETRRLVQPAARRAHGSHLRSDLGFVGRCSIGLIAATGFMIGVAWTRPSERPNEGASPTKSFGADLRGAGVLGFAIGATAAGTLTLVLLSLHGLVSSVPGGIAAGVALGLVTSACASQAVALVMVNVALRIRGVAPLWLLTGQPAKRRPGCR